MKNNLLIGIFLIFAFLLTTNFVITNPVSESMNCDSNYYCTINHNYLLFNHKSHIQLSPHSILELRYQFANYVLTVENNNEERIVFLRKLRGYDYYNYTNAFKRYLNNPSNGLELTNGDSLKNSLSLISLVLTLVLILRIISIPIYNTYRCRKLDKMDEKEFEMLLHSNDPEVAIEQLIASKERRFNRKKR